MALKESIGDLVTQPETREMARRMVVANSESLLNDGHRHRIAELEDALGDCVWLLKQLDGRTNAGDTTGPTNSGGRAA